MVEVIHLLEWAESLVSASELEKFPWSNINFNTLRKLIYSFHLCGEGRLREVSIRQSCSCSAPLRIPDASRKSQSFRGLAAQVPDSTQALFHC